MCSNLKLIRNKVEKNAELLEVVNLRHTSRRDVSHVRTIGIVRGHIPGSWVCFASDSYLP